MKHIDEIAASPGLPSPTEAQTEGAMVSRRRWLRTGLKATPVVLTLASQPVLAWQCKTPSAYGSFMVGSRAARGLVTYTKSPGTSSDWLKKCNAPTTVCYPTGGGGALEFPYGLNESSPCSALMGSGSSSSLKTMLTSGTAWDKAMVTAMLNCKTLRTESSCATETTLAAMWTQGDSYSPSAGKIWSKAMVVDYLVAAGFALP